MTAFKTVFQDDDCVVVDKPSGLLTMPGRGLAAAEKNLRDLLSSSLAGPVYVVHRLDRDASGLILFARNEQAHRHFSQLFGSDLPQPDPVSGGMPEKKDKEIKKKYLAAVEGEVLEKRGEIDKPVRAYGSGRMGVGFDGKPSVTRYEVLERYKRSTLLEVELVTGRRHQIRVHMYYMKHPVIGDRLYGDQARQSAYPRLMLHSYSLEFRDMSGRKKTLKADPPEDFLCVLPFL
jgi:23S rRNA-/tRNA-specific pseudouridylate synthase